MEVIRNGGRSTFLEREPFMKTIGFSEVSEGGDVLSMDEKRV